MIGVCIKYFHENYGGMLQAFSTVKMLESRGIDYELIRYKKRLTMAEKICSVPRLLNTVLLNDKYETFLKKQGMRKHPEFKKNDAIRMKAFDQFKSREFTRLSPEFCGYKALCEGAKRYDAVITGSDQLWSPAGLPTNFYNLLFVPDDVKKISYASSFGVSEIPWYQKKRTADFLRRLDYISMRENRGSEIVKELTDLDVPVILDPVFNFNKKQWEKMIPIKEEINEPYIFAYFLGANSEYRKQVQKLAEMTGLDVVALRHMDQYVENDERFGDYAPYDVAPDRFLNLLRGAEYICTDSFHGACFSIINNKKFMIFSRYANASTTSKNSRIDSLCENLGISDRRFSGDISEIQKPIDYETVYLKLENLQRRTIEYLDTAFGNVK